MKTTLTQAWEARGVHGILLRSRVRTLLIERFYEDKVRRREAFVAVSGMLVAVFVGLLFAGLYGPMTAAVGQVDWSRTNQALLGFFGLVLLFGIIPALGLFAVYIVARAMYAIGYIDRYIIQNLNTEVEL